MLLRTSFFLVGALLAGPGISTTASANSPAVTAIDAKTNAIGALDPRRDYHSYAEPEKIRVRHIALDLSADFTRKQLSGNAQLQLVRSDKTADELVLDTRDLVISAVSAGVGTQLQATTFSLDAVDPILGQALRIKLPANADNVRIDYHTMPQSTALQWLTPAQTAGKKHPFLFSQSQAIHARSWIPLQDTPQVRVTYSARIRTPKNLRAVMSADNDPKAPLNGDYRFNMPQPISSYLIALAIGDVQFKAMSARTGVYAEPLTLNKAVREFADTEAMVLATEKLYGDYSWGRYDLLILPPSFPFGGMENPRLSFITPTVIAGDKSLVNLIAHELAHSWSGNTVTNSTWRDLWLNEGFTSYVENRIMESVYGRDAAVMDQVLSMKSLNDDLAAAKDGDRVLAIDVRGRDPDDTFSDIPYVKGQMFLHYLENAYGRDIFDQFLHGYFAHFHFQTLNSEDFVAYLDTQLLKKYPGKVSTEKVQEWIYGQGMPSDAPQPKTMRFTDIETAAAKIGADSKAIATLDAKKWSTQEWLHFIDHLPQPTNLELMQKLDARFKFTGTGNSEVAHRWYLLSLRSGYKVVEPALSKYLISIGRRKLIVPLYEELAKTEHGKAFARKTYAQARPGYHPIAQATLDKMLNFTAKK